jgi:two-component system, OmpR family, KDP operon response regulator KdpE
MSISKTKSPSTSPLVLAVDDDPSVGRLIGMALRVDGFRVLLASSAEDAERILCEQVPDLVLLDIVMPGTSGLTLLRRLREQSDMPVVLLTAKDTEADKVDGLNLGADDYIVKPFNPEELGARVRAVLRRGSTPASERLVRVGELEIDLDRRTVSLNGQPILLSGTEWRLLHQLALHAGRVVPSGSLLEKVWGPAYREDLQYLRVWIWRLRQKFEPDSANPALLKTARE